MPIEETPALENSTAHGHRLELLLSQLNEFVMVTADTEGNFTSWHPGVERTFGYTADEFIGRNAEALYTPEDRAAGLMQKELEEAARTGRSSDTRWLVKKGGKRILVAGVTVGLHVRGGMLAGFGKVFRDVTEWKNSENARLDMQRQLEVANERLRRMTEELERSNEELEDFARIASHDLSAPLTSTRWLVELLNTQHSNKLDPGGRECLKQISRSLERMSQLIEAVLAHAQFGRSAIGSPESTSAAAALEIALENLRSEIESSEADISHDPLPDLLVEPHALTRLFQNLLSNAMKYRRPGPRPVIKISAKRPTVAEGTMWLIGVEDNGIGIQAEWFERIFLPMQRLHGPEITGSGIGLATCKKIVSRAGGKIWVESQVGRGATFFFTLPGPPAQAPEQGAWDSSAEARDSAG